MLTVTVSEVLLVPAVEAVLELYETGAEVVTGVPGIGTVAVAMITIARVQQLFKG